MTYLPYIVTTKENAESFLDGMISFTSIIPEEFKTIPDAYPMDYLKLGLKRQLQDRAIVDLSDFSSSALILFTCKPDERLQQFGDTIIVITRPEIFFQQLNTVNDQMYPNLKYLFASEVIYDDELFDENIRNQVLNPFVHHSVDAWKKEIMILSRVKPSIALSERKTDDLFIIPEGIRDIAVEMVLESAIDDLTKNGKFSVFQIEIPEEAYPMLTGIEISISGNIQYIKPEKEWIEKLRNSFGDDWEAITRIVVSPDGKSEVPCLGFTNRTTTVVFQVNTIWFSFAIDPHSYSDNCSDTYNDNHGDVHSDRDICAGNTYDISKCFELVDKVVRRTEKICTTSFAYPSIILTSDMGEVTGAYIRNKELEIRKSVDYRGLIHWYGLAINNLVKPGLFGLLQVGKNHWMLREQLISPDNTLWYDAEKILAFFRKAYKEIWAHMNELSSKDIVNEIIKI